MEYAPQKSRSRKVYVILGIIIVILAAVWLGAYLYQQNHKVHVPTLDEMRASLQTQVSAEAAAAPQLTTSGRAKVQADTTQAAAAVSPLTDAQRLALQAQVAAQAAATR